MLAWLQIPKGTHSLNTTPYYQGCDIVEINQTFGREYVQCVYFLHEFFVCHHLQHIISAQRGAWILHYEDRAFHVTSRHVTSRHVRKVRRRFHDVKIVQLQQFSRTNHNETRATCRWVFRGSYIGCGGVCAFLRTCMNEGTNQCTSWSQPRGKRLRRPILATIVPAPKSPPPPVFLFDIPCLL